MTAADECVHGFADMNLITTRASKITSGARLSEGLSLFSAFSCNGKLASLVLGVDVRTENKHRKQYPEISLWRSHTSDEIYDFVPGSKRTVRITPAKFSPSGVFDYVLDVPLDFQANDVLGWTQPSDEQSVVRMYTINGSVWMIKRTIPITVSSNSLNLTASYSSDEIPLLYPLLVTGKLQLCRYSFLYIYNCHCFYF